MSDSWSLQITDEELSLFLQFKVADQLLSSLKLLLNCNAKLSRIYKDVRRKKKYNNETVEMLEGLKIEIEENKKKIEEIKMIVVDKYNPIPEKLFMRLYSRIEQAIFLKMRFHITSKRNANMVLKSLSQTLEKSYISQETKVKKVAESFSTFMLENIYLLERMESLIEQKNLLNALGQYAESLNVPRVKVKTTRRISFLSNIDQKNQHNASNFKSKVKIPESQMKIYHQYQQQQTSNKDQSQKRQGSNTTKAKMFIHTLNLNKTNKKDNRTKTAKRPLRRPSISGQNSPLFKRKSLMFQFFPFRQQFSNNKDIILNIKSSKHFHHHKQKVTTPQQPHQHHEQQNKKTITLQSFYLKQKQPQQKKSILKQTKTVHNTSTSSLSKQLSFASKQSQNKKLTTPRSPLMINSNERVFENQKNQQIHHVSSKSSFFQCSSKLEPKSIKRRYKHSSNLDQLFITAQGMYNNNNNVPFKSLVINSNISRMSKEVNMQTEKITNIRLSEEVCFKFKEAVGGKIFNNKGAIQTPQIKIVRQIQDKSRKSRKFLKSKPKIYEIYHPNMRKIVQKPIY